MKPTLLILIYHGLGHIHATLGLVKILNRNFRVIFVGHPYFEKNVRFYGFDFVAVRSMPFGLGFEKWTCEVRKHSPVYLFDLIYRIRDKLNSERAAELQKILDEIKPECVLIDSWQSTDIIVLYEQLKKMKTRVGFLQTMLSTIEEKNIPALNSPLLPEEFSGRINFLQSYFRRASKDLLKKIKYLGFDNDYLIQRRMRFIRFPEKYVPTKRSIFSPHFNNIPELILAPAEFDFALRKHDRFQRHIGFQTEMSRPEENDPAFQSAFQQLLAEQKQKGYPIIYCALGSVKYHEHLLLSQMLTKVIQAADVIKAKLIIACNNQTVAQQLKPVHGGHLFFKTVPQLEVLKFASIVICHGGLNTIKESLASEVPMLILPISNDVDHNGNSSRVVVNGIGLRNNAARFTVSELVSQIKELLANPCYKQNIRLMLKKDRQYTVEGILEAISSLQSLD